MWSRPYALPQVLHQDADSASAGVFPRRRRIPGVPVSGMHTTAADGMSSEFSADPALQRWIYRIDPKRVNEYGQVMTTDADTIAEKEGKETKKNK